MAGEKFMQLQSNGRLKEIEAAQTGGTGYENKIPALDATGKLALTMMPTGVSAEVISAEASEDLSAGDYVNLYLDTTLKCRKADAASGKPAHGFVLAAVSNGNTATVYHDGENDQVTGKTIGADQFLSNATPGATTETAPTTGFVQRVGIATAATKIMTWFGPIYERAS